MTVLEVRPLFEIPVDTLEVSAARVLTPDQAVERLMSKRYLHDRTRSILLATVLIDGTYEQLVQVLPFVDINYVFTQVQYRDGSVNQGALAYLVTFRDIDIDKSKLLLLVSLSNNDSLIDALIVASGLLYQTVIITELLKRRVGLGYSVLLQLSARNHLSDQAWVLNETLGIVLTPDEILTLLVATLTTRSDVFWTIRAYVRYHLAVLPPKEVILDAVFPPVSYWRMSNIHEANLSQLARLVVERTFPIRVSEYLERAIAVNDRAAEDLLRALSYLDQV